MRRHTTPIVHRLPALVQENTARPGSGSGQGIGNDQGDTRMWGYEEAHSLIYSNVLHSGQETWRGFSHHCT